jgi:hypothetical protein
VSTVGSVDNKSNSTAGSKPKSIEKKSTVGSSDLSATDNENEFTMTTADAAKVLELSPRQVRTYAERGELHGKQGKQSHWFFRQSDVGKFWATRDKE